MRYVQFTLILFLSFSVVRSQEKYTSKVNPFIGTGAAKGSPLSGNNYPGAAVPFGMVQLSPDTRNIPDWSVASGYNYNDTSIAGFSHTHLSGTGVAELFDIMITPFTGNVEKDQQKGNPYESRFSHDNEYAYPGYYSVLLEDYNIKAELTASAHVGFHSYSFPKGKEAHIMLDLDHSMKKSDWNTRIIASQIKFVDEYTIEGFRIITGWAPMRKVYYYIKFSQPIFHNYSMDGTNVYENAQVINGNAIKTILDFNISDNQQVLIKVGLSATSIANARNNLITEIGDWNFEKAVHEANGEWENELSKIQIEGTASQEQIFYTALYHSFLQPNIISDVTNDYPSADYTVEHGVGPYYSTFSLWDTYRAAHPLYTILQRERTAHFVNSMLLYYDTFGYLPIWQLWGQENYCMIGNHAVPVIADAILKGVDHIDIEKAYEAVKASLITEHYGSPFKIWNTYGYIPENLKSQSVSLTLEMAFDDYCMALLAKRFGEKTDEFFFSERAKYYKNLYDEHIGFFRAKDDNGKWIKPFDPLKYGANGGYPFTEGNGWQYFWYVPHDIEGLIALVGGKNIFKDKLDTFFTLNQHPKEINDNASGFIGQYAHGNEPSHHIAYLYNYVGTPWKTQEYTWEILNQMYNTSSSGYAGNDDCGELSAWYVFSAMGIYPVNPASGIYDIGTPVLKKSVLKVDKDKVFIISAKNVSAENKYIQKVTLNGKKYNRPFITHDDIMNGGTLEFTMGSKPNKKWGVNK